MISLHWVRPTGQDEAAVLAALREGRLAGRQAVADFEAAFARYLGVAPGCAVATSSGTAALFAICATLLRPGDEVITTPFTFIATAAAVAAVGAVPVFADVDPRTGNLDPGAAAEALSRCRRPRAVLAVHLYGHPAPLAELADLCRRHGLLLLEDCAQAAGAQVGGRPVGTWGDAAAFSFYATKNLAAGEGGMAVLRDPGVAEAVRRFVDHGRGTDPDRHLTLGLNLRMHGLAAALALARLGRLDAENQVRRRHAAALRQALAELPWLELPPDHPGHVYHLFTVRCPWRDALQRHLAEHGVEARPYYPDVLYRQPALADHRPPAPCAAAETLAATAIALPVHPGLDAGQVAAVAAAVHRFQPPRGGGP